MFIAPDFLDHPAFEVVEPEEQRVPFVMNSPHSGRRYPERFLRMSRLDADAIRRSEDFFVDELFAPSLAFGAPMLKAHFPRAYVDVNREPYELDQRMYRDRLPTYANRNSVRVAGGLGTVPRVVCEGVNIYEGRLPASEAMMRVEDIYKPYHSMLRGLLTRTHRKFGVAVLVDCHSMPASVHLGPEGGRPDFIIGNRYGTSASPLLSDAAAHILTAMGYHVAMNQPYAGGFITEHYGRPARGLHAVQIEVNRSLYIDEKTLKKKPGFEALKDDLTQMMARLTTIGATDLSEVPLAAE